MENILSDGWYKIGGGGASLYLKDTRLSSRVECRFWLGCLMGPRCHGYKTDRLFRAKSMASEHQIINGKILSIVTRLSMILSFHVKTDFNPNIPVSWATSFHSRWQVTAKCLFVANCLGISFKACSALLEYIHFIYAEC